ncbi:MAG: sugar phosphate isomerase/epimerase [Firmicutes bacterium]|nr:sugar phosphate isomerase/epimerase [Bacillota bacterium]
MKVAVSTWSLRDHVNKDFLLKDFPGFVKERYGVDAVELCQMHFQAQDARYLDEIVDGLRKAGAIVINMPVDTGNISQPDERKRNHDLEVMKGWMDVAAYIGCPSVRINTGSQDGSQGSGVVDLSITMNSYRRLVEYGEEIGVMVLLENHGGISADPDNIVRLFEGVGHKNFRACPDFGNFAPEVRYRGLEAMARYAVMAHAKTYDFDEKGRVPQFDFARCISILKGAGFDGYLSVEFEGKGDQLAGVRRTIELIKENWG